MIMLLWLGYGLYTDYVVGGPDEAMDAMVDDGPTNIERILPDGRALMKDGSIRRL